MRGTGESMASDGRIIVALDVDSEERARRIVADLGGACRSYKLGLEFLTSCGPGLAHELAAGGNEVFWDLKLFEIPASVAGAVRAAGRSGATLVTVHAMGGPRILDAAVEAARAYPQLRVLALTVVTSMTDDDLAAVGIGAGVYEQVPRLARLARDAGCHGVVGSASDAERLRAVLGPDPLIVTPGVSVGSGAATDHARPASPAAAIAAGASHVVLGRAITGAADPLAVFDSVQMTLPTCGLTDTP